MTDAKRLRMAISIMIDRIRNPQNHNSHIESLQSMLVIEDYHSQDAVPYWKKGPNKAKPDPEIMLGSHPPKPEPDKWWVSRDSDSDYFRIWNKKPIFYHSINGTFGIQNGKCHLMSMEALKYLDITLPGMSMCIEIPSPTGSPLIEKITELESKLESAKSLLNSFSNRERQLKQQNQELTKEHEEFRTENLKMRRWTKDLTTRNFLDNDQLHKEAKAFEHSLEDATK